MRQHEQLVEEHKRLGAQGNAILLSVTAIEQDKFIKDCRRVDFADSAEETNGRDQLLRQL